MKKRRTISHSHRVAAVGATALLAAMSGHAQVADAIASHLYIGAEGGVALAQNMAIRDGTGFNGAGGDVKFQTGWRADGYVGYNVCRYFAAQLDSGAIWNNINTIGDQPLSGVASAHLEQVPVVAEGIFRYPLGRFKPYLLGGAGADFGCFKGNLQSLGGPPNYNDTDSTFAYEGGIGFTYSLTRHLDVGAAYKFFGTTDHGWTSGGIALKTGGTMEHTFDATLSWRF